ncbi:MAG: ATP-binding protein [Simkaniaceae bacterium]
MKYPRFIQKKVERALEDTSVVFINGPRQSGKSTLAHHFAKKECVYITLDDLLELEAAKSSPQSFLDRNAERIIIDEIQRVPELFLAIKEKVDKKRIPGQFLLTGSANILLLPNLSDSLAGRMEILTLYPLSRYEIQKKPFDLITALFNAPLKIPKNEERSPHRMIQGGFPEVHNRKDSQRQAAWFQSYLTTILERDVRDLSQIEGLTRLPNLLKLLATRSGNLLNFDELSRSCGIPSTTLKRYFTLIQTVFMVHLLPPYFSHLEKRLVKSPKVYLSDTGILSYLLGLDLKGIQKNQKSWGSAVETFVVNELIKQATWSDLSVQLYYYRNFSGMEVDLILESRDGKIIAIEIKAKVEVNINDFRGLKHFKETFKDRFIHGYVFYLGEKQVPFDKDLTALPLPF